MELARAIAYTEDPNHGITPHNDYGLQNHSRPGFIRDVQNDYKKFIVKNSNSSLE